MFLPPWGQNFLSREHCWVLNPWKSTLLPSSHGREKQPDEQFLFAEEARGKWGAELCVCRRWRWQDGSQPTLSELCNKATHRARQGVGSRGKMGPRLWPGQLPVLARASLVFTIIFIFCESGYHEVRSVSNSLAHASASQMMVL